jgi:tetratricopeptide (TPR) repeat protein
MSLLLDALKTAEGQAQRNRSEEPARRDAGLTDHQILTLAEDEVAAPATAAPAKSPSAKAASTTAASGSFRHNPAAFPPIADTMRTRVPGGAGPRRWVKPALLAVLVLVAAAVLWMVFRPAAPLPALVPPAFGSPAAAVDVPATDAPVEQSRADSAGFDLTVDFSKPARGADEDVPVTGDSTVDPAPVQPAPAASRVDRSPVVISGRPSPLLAAHAALRAGDMQRAESLYRQTLAAEPDQPDAHLGMALIEQSRGARAAALAQYRAVLVLRPGDPQAWAGLSDLTGDGELEAMESRLRSLIATRPDPALHFALGNIMARQSRWPDAQESYFAAATGAPQNADYAFNLAVALDQLGKGRAASAHYAKALALAGDARAVQFDADAARVRMQQLEAANP